MVSNITLRPDGRYMVRLQVGGVRKTAYAKTEAEARAKLKALQQQALLNGGFAHSQKRTLADLCAAWLASADIRESTRLHHEYTLRYVLPVLGSIRLDKLTPERVEALYRSLSPAIAHRVHLVLHRAFTVAVRWRWLAANPCDCVEPPRHRPNKPILWNAAQIKAFVTAAQPYPLLVLLVTTGMRLGEALALRWRDVGLGGAAVTVRETARWVNGRWMFNLPKTASGMRTVLLPEPAREVLKGLRAALGDVPDAEIAERFLFESKRKRGQPVHPVVAYDQLRATCAAAGVPRIRIHDLRHLHASLLLAEGVPVPEVAARLGHANPSVTMTIYAHALGSQAASVAALERVMSQRQEG